MQRKRLMNLQYEKQNYRNRTWMVFVVCIPYGDADNWSFGSACFNFLTLH